MKDKKILLVEDDKLMSRMYKRVFTLQGFNIELAEDGVEGYEKAKTFQPNLIFLDVMMPKMNGFELLEKLKADPETKDIAVIMLTNLANKLDIDAALRRGVWDYLVKSDHDSDDVVAVAKKFFGE
jgi:two-component system alkaline phosphatase synthesis response regulator PhoP